MKNWNYKELIEAIEESYDDLINQKDDSDHAIARIFDDFYFYPEEENIVENFITSIFTTKLRIEKLNFVYQSEIDFLKNYIEKRITDSVLRDQLSVSDLKDLKDNLDKLLQKIEDTKIRKMID